MTTAELRSSLAAGKAPARLMLVLTKGRDTILSDLAEPFEMAGVDSGGTSLLAFAGSAALTTAGTSSATGFFRLAALVAIGGADYAGHGHPGKEPSCSRRLRRSQTAQTSRILPSTTRKMIISLTENGFSVAGSVREATLSMPVWVPVKVRRATTLSPSLMSSSTCH